MTYDEAIDILDPSTSRDALFRMRMNGVDELTIRSKVNEACRIACECIRTVREIEHGKDM